MKILVSAHFFPPDVGGIPEVASILVREFLDAGHAVRVVTSTCERAGREPCEVLRAPGAGALLGAVRWCDAALHVQLGLRSAWPLVMIKRPWVVSHHAHLRAGGWFGVPLRMKREVLGAATNVAVSRALAATLPVPCGVVGNPYRDDVFFADASAQRDRDVLFVGRMTPDKGADVLAAALGILRERGRAVSATFLGDGPERERVRAAAPDARFLPATGDREAVAAAMREHRVVAVPSRGAEPFGLTAVEGLACGCAVVGSAGGGLEEAMGLFGEAFPEEDAGALADAVARALDRGAPEPGAVSEHLAQFRPAAVAARYLEALERAAG